MPDIERETGLSGPQPGHSTLHNKPAILMPHAAALQKPLGHCSAGNLLSSCAQVRHWSPLKPEHQAQCAAGAHPES